MMSEIRTTQPSRVDGKMRFAKARAVAGNSVQCLKTDVKRKDFVKYTDGVYVVAEMSAGVLEINFI